MVVDITPRKCETLAQFIFDHWHGAEEYKDDVDGMLELLNAQKALEKASKDCKDFTPRQYIPYIDYGCKAAGKSRSEPRRRGIKIEIKWERSEKE